MGYAVLHLEKAKGADSGMSAHIERTIQPKNADCHRSTQQHKFSSCWQQDEQTGERECPTA